MKVQWQVSAACTHWNAPPCQGAHVKRTLQITIMEAFESCNSSRRQLKQYRTPFTNSPLALSQAS